MVTAKKADFYGIAEKYHIDPVTARLLRNRDIIGDDAIEEYLNGSLLNLHSPHLMKGMDKATALLLEKIDSQRRIRVIGDYDIDGVTSTCILLTGFARCGAEADYEIPDRVKDGYGLNRNLIQSAYEDGIDTIVTCDNGISAIEEISYAKELGMTVIVTDHHAVRRDTDDTGYLLPSADVVINPHQPGCPYPFKELCGAAVAWKLVQSLYEACGFAGEEIEQFIELVAVATVGDVVPLVGENRILVKEGLFQLNHTENKGLRALIQVNNLQDGEINAYHIGFVLGPCINASGRLDTARKALELLLAQSEAEATELAEELLYLNNERKEMTQAACDEAVCLIENGGLKRDKVLVVYLPSCHESIAGIVAGRLRERYYRPAFVLTDGERSVKGSGRSIEGYSMFEEMQKCADLFLNYGGHPMAAGCSLKKENVELLRERLNEQTSLTEEDLTEKIRIDVPMPVDYLSEALVMELAVLEPFGTGNPKPVFADRNLRLLGARILGRNRNVLKLQVMSSQGRILDAMFFGDIEGFRQYLERKFSVVETEKLFQNRSNSISLSLIYYPSINEFHGVRTLQIVISDYQ